MINLLKKILVLIPVTLLGYYYLSHRYARFSNHVTEGRILLLWLSFFLLYAWTCIEIVRRKQDSVFVMGTQASFFVYVFMVLTLTGYFVLFREISVHDWHEKMMLRIERKDHVNLELFKMFKIYKLSSLQVLGNFVMLLPLGIYLPLLYRRLSNFFVVVFIACLVSATIEILQLVTSYRSADVDDILLNTLGAALGFCIYSLFRQQINAPPSKNIEGTLAGNYQA
jgi:glycopeptide antibiotics resistance protein